MSGTGVRPRVSVVTIFLDSERFLQEAIESVLAQSSTDWELLLIDDGSTDGSTALAQTYAAQYPGRVRYFDHPGHRNVGKSTSRNLGIREARGEYVTFLDADDVLLPDKLERQTRLLAAHPEAAMVYGRTEYWFSWTGELRARRRDFIPGLGSSHGAPIEPPALVSRFLRRGGSVPCLCGVLARTAAVVEVGGFDESIQDLYEDQVLLAKLCLEWPVLVETGCGERYRQHPDSSSSAAIRSGAYHPWRPNRARAAYLDWLAAYATGRGISDPAFWKAMRAELRLYRHPIAARLASPILHLAQSVSARLETWR